MSGDIRQASAPGLDPASRRALARFGCELAWFGLIAAAPLLAGLANYGAAITAFGTYCSFASLLRVVIATRRHERPGGPSLTSWDECLALAAAAMLAYGVAHWVG